jgi:hypothetical protein
VPLAVEKKGEMTLAQGIPCSTATRGKCHCFCYLGPLYDMIGLKNPVILLENPIKCVTNVPSFSFNSYTMSVKYLSSTVSCNMV